MDVLCAMCDVNSVIGVEFNINNLFRINYSAYVIQAKRFSFNIMNLHYGNNLPKSFFKNSKPRSHCLKNIRNI